MRKIYALILCMTYLHISVGQVIFQKEYGEGNWDHGNSVLQSTDGGYVVAGESNDSAYVMKTDAYGGTLWAKHYSRRGIFSSVQPTGDGGIFYAVQ